MTTLPASPVPDLTTIEITSQHEALLQRFFEANPGYYTDYYGEPPRPDEAAHEIHDALPQGWAFMKK